MLLTGIASSPAPFHPYLHVHQSFQRFLGRPSKSSKRNVVSVLGGWKCNPEQLGSFSDDYSAAAACHSTLGVVSRDVLLAASTFAAGKI